MKLLVFVVALAFLGFGMDYASFGQVVKKKGVEKVQAKPARVVYSCPKHPEVTSNKPGNCSKCGTKLVKKVSKPVPPQTQMYVCPMHPEVTSTKPGECPKCGMDLVKK